MMQVVNNPDRREWATLLQRPFADDKAARETAVAVLDAVRTGGDAALRRYAAQFDGVTLQDLRVTETEFAEAEHQVPEALKTAIRQAKANIEAFHAPQRTDGAVVETMPGVRCWRRSVGIEKVGLYIPGGTAPLFSTVLMLAVPAQLAGCREVVLCTPCDKNGTVHPAVLFSARVCGVSQVFKIGGAQAVAAMAFGTETVPAVYKIFGPGNRYVTAAKQLAQLHGVAIDMPAGPSEVCVLADETAVPAFVAADLLSQAEHGADSQVLLVCRSEGVVQAVQAELARQLPLLPRADVAAKALANSRAVLLPNLDEALEFVNAYAAEHLIISHADAEALASRIHTAGSVFIGNHSPESVGDYASGTNHTLPTAGFARAFSGVSVDSFVKKITFQHLSPEGLQNIADTVLQMAEAEGLEAHANAVRVRMGTA